MATTTMKEIIGIENIISLILVNENVLPACLLSLSINNDGEGNNSQMLQWMQQMFPTMIFAERYEDYSGILISKEALDSNEKVVEMLAYPCSPIRSRRRSFIHRHIIDLVAVTNMGEFTIHTNVCEDVTNPDQFNVIAERAKHALCKLEYQPLMYIRGVLMIIEDVKVKIVKEISTQSILEKMIQNGSCGILIPDDKAEISNILYNFGFSRAFQIFFEDNFQYTNPIHQGILIMLLLNDINNVLEPFHPLYKYLEEDDKLRDILMGMESQLTEYIRKTIIHY